jgi:hypothetical protein
MTFWFGEPWPSEDGRSPVCEEDLRRVPTPIGRACVLCERPVAAGDRGEMIPAIHGDGTTSVEATHIECSLRAVLGCYASLTGAGHDHERDYREDALEVWQDFTRGRFHPGLH